MLNTKTNYKDMLIIKLSYSIEKVTGGHGQKKLAMTTYVGCSVKVVDDLFFIIELSKNTFK